MTTVTDTDIQDAMKQAALGAAEILRGLSNADRLLLMCQLSQGKRALRSLKRRWGSTSLRCPSSWGYCGA